MTFLSLFPLYFPKYCFPLLRSKFLFQKWRKQKNLWVVYFYLTVHHHVLNQDSKTHHSRLDKITSLTHAKPHSQSLKKLDTGSTPKNRERMGLTGESLGDPTTHLLPKIITVQPFGLKYKRTTKNHQTNEKTQEHE